MSTERFCAHCKASGDTTSLTRCDQCGLVVTSQTGSAFAQREDFVHVLIETCTMRDPSTRAIVSVLTDHAPEQGSPPLYEDIERLGGRKSVVLCADCASSCGLVVLGERP